jgi:hypothetical protein
MGDEMVIACASPSIWQLPSQIAIDARTSAHVSCGRREVACHKQCSNRSSFECRPGHIILPTTVFVIPERMEVINYLWRDEYLPD